MKNETELKQEFIKVWKKIYGGHLTPIESNLTHQGISDLNVCCEGMQEFWVEFKIDNYELSPLQFSWMIQHNLTGGRAFVIRWNNNHLKFKINDIIVFDKIEGVVNFIAGEVNGK